MVWQGTDGGERHTRRAPGNRPITEEIYPESPDDWLIVAGDVSEKADDIRWA